MPSSLPIARCPNPNPPSKIFQYDLYPREKNEGFICHHNNKITKNVTLTLHGCDFWPNVTFFFFFFLIIRAPPQSKSCDLADSQISLLLCLVSCWVLKYLVNMSKKKCSSFFIASWKGWLMKTSFHHLHNSSQSHSHIHRSTHARLILHASFSYVWTKSLIMDGHLFLTSLEYIFFYAQKGFFQICVHGGIAPNNQRVCMFGSGSQGEW